MYNFSHTNRPIFCSFTSRHNYDYKKPRNSLYYFLKKLTFIWKLQPLYLAPVRNFHTGTYYGTCDGFSQIWNLALIVIHSVNAFSLTWSKFHEFFTGYNFRIGCNISFSVTINTSSVAHFSVFLYMFCFACKHFTDTQTISRLLHLVSPDSFSGPAYLLVATRLDFIDLWVTFFYLHVISTDTM